MMLKAYAKINLTLEVLSKREDGYHEIDTVLQTVNLADTLSFEHSDTLEFRCNDPGLMTDDNLVMRAARLLGNVTGCGKGVVINLDKKIPVAAGLGSGATDAAAALVGLNQLWGAGFSREKLVELAANLGSDVAFFLYGGTARAKGRGEIVSPLPSISTLWLSILNPPVKSFPDKTAHLYAQLQRSNFTTGQYTDRLLSYINEVKEIDSTLLYNVFEQVAFDFFPELKEYRSRLIDEGAESVHLAGAGPALFTLVSDEAQGRSMQRNLEADGLEAYLVSTVEKAPLTSVSD